MGKVQDAVTSSDTSRVRSFEIGNCPLLRSHWLRSGVNQSEALVLCSCECRFCWVSCDLFVLTHLVADVCLMTLLRLRHLALHSFTIGWRILGYDVLLLALPITLHEISYLKYNRAR